MFKFLELLISHETSEGVLDFSRLSAPDPEAVARRDKRIAVMKRQMGETYLLHKAVNREKTMPSEPSRARMRRVK
jgi:hypothetical protein